MSNLVHMQSHSHFTPAQIQIIRKSVAPDTNDDELNLFIETAKLHGLNPMKKQISARVYNKDNAAKRSMAIIVQIDGFRAIAARGGNYRPDDDEPHFVYSADLKSDTNPLGIERATVKAFKQDNNGDWQTIKGTAYWDEFAPTQAEWAPDENGKRRPTGKQTLADNWRKMPRLMLAKCAEAQALRKGWPEDLGGLYSDEETQVAEYDGTASEMLRQAESDARMKRIGGGKDDLPLQFEPAGAIELIPVGRFADNVLQHIEECETALEVEQFRARNQDALKRFWTGHPTDALDLKRVMEKREAALKQREVA